MPVRPIKLRRAASADAREVADIYIASRRGAVEFMPTVHTDDEIRGWIASVLVPNLEVWVAEVGGRISGFVALDGEMLDQLFIAPNLQRQGIGDRLLNKAKELSPRRLRLYTFQKNAPARHFYEARGFVAIEFNDGSRNEEQAPDVLYEWTPGPAARGARENAARAKT
jgi:GNAT superfamily N-acetyltransferase